MLTFASLGKDPKAPTLKVSNSILSAFSTFSDDWLEVEYIARSAFLGPTPPTAGYYATVALVLVAPLSRRAISTSSADTAVQPVIDPGWLAHPADQEVAIAAFKRAREIPPRRRWHQCLLGWRLCRGMEL
jgi:choline dehydrogenase